MQLMALGSPGDDALEHVDPGMRKCVQRLLRLHAYEPILFSSADAFKNYTDVEKAACVILDINLNGGSGIELRHGSERRRDFRARDLYDRQ